MIGITKLFKNPNLKLSQNCKFEGFVCHYSIISNFIYDITVICAFYRISLKIAFFHKCTNWVIYRATLSFLTIVSFRFVFSQFLFVQINIKDKKKGNQLGLIYCVPKERNIYIKFFTFERNWFSSNNLNQFSNSI